MVKYDSEAHETLCKDPTIPPKVWISLALQLLLRLEKITETDFLSEIDKLKLPPTVRRNLIRGKHCMISPLADMASMLGVTHILMKSNTLNEESLFWAMLCQIAVHSGDVLRDMTREDHEAGKTFDTRRMGRYFHRSMKKRKLKTSMNTKLSQPVLKWFHQFSNENTHMSFVQGFIERFDFRNCAEELSKSKDHEDRMQILRKFSCKITLRHVQVLRLLEATVCPDWTGAWSDPFIGPGAKLCLPEMSSEAFHSFMMRNVEELAPTWLLPMLDELPIKLDTLQTSQHVRCEVRKLTGNLLSEYVPNPNSDFLRLFSTMSRLFGLGTAVNNSNTRNRPYTFYHDLATHKRCYQHALQQKGTDEALVKRYRRAIELRSDLQVHLTHVGSWLLSIEDYQSTSHDHLVCLLIDGLNSLEAGHIDEQCHLKQQRLKATMGLVLERGDECNCQHHKRLWHTLLPWYFASDGEARSPMEGHSPLICRTSQMTLSSESASTSSTPQAISLVCDEDAEGSQATTSLAKASLAKNDGEHLPLAGAGVEIQAFANLAQRSWNKDSMAVSGDRSGRTFLVTRDGVLFFQQLDGDEKSASGPPHDQLRVKAGIGFERILAGGAVTTDMVKWLSGTCQLGPTLKRAVNDVVSTDKERRALRDIGSFDLQIADAAIRRLVFQNWDSSSAACCSVPLPEDAMDQIRAATDEKHEVVIQKLLGILEGGGSSEHDQILDFLLVLGKASINHTEANTICPKQRLNLCERALPLAESHFGVQHQRIGILFADLASAHRELGNATECRDCLERALPIDEAHYGKDHYEVAITLTGLGNAYGALGQPEKKKELLERALSIEEAHYGKDHYEVAITLTNLGNAYGDLGQPEKKKELLERALPINEAHYGKDHYQVAMTLTNLGNAYGALGQPEKQKELLERALPINEAHYGKDHYEVAITEFNLAMYLLSKAQREEAGTRLCHVRDVFISHFGANHPHTQLSIRKLAECDDCK